MQMDEYIPTDEAAKLAKFGLDHMRLLARKGIVASRKFNAAVMIDRASLLAYLATDRSQKARALKVSQARAKASTTKGKEKAKK